MKKNNKKGFTLIELSIVLIIVGLVVVGVTSGSKLIDLAALSKARTLTNTSPVNGTEDLVLWMETTHKESLLDSEEIHDSRVSYWKDLNPQASRNNATQTDVDATKPFYKTNGINSLPSLYFSGNSHRLYLPDNSVLSKNISGITAFAVVSLENVNTWHTILGVSGSPNMIIGFINGRPILFLGIVGGNHPVGATTLDINTPYIISYRQDVILGEVFINGTLDGQLNRQAGAIPFNFNDAGRYMSSSNSSYSFDGWLGEIIVFDRALGEIEMNDIEKYLSNKWGIALAG